MTPIIEVLAVMLSNSLAASILAKVTITTSLTLVVVCLARRSRAAVRHIMLAGSFTVLLTLPIASVIIPAIHIAMPVAAHDGGMAASFDRAIESFPSSTISRASAPAMPAASRPSLPSLPVLLLAGWLIGATLFMVPVVIGLWQMRSMRRSSLPWRVGKTTIDNLATDVRIHRRVDVLLHESTPGPMTCGTLYPVVILPLDAQVWTQQALSRALVHELEHVQRCDWISQCLARAICAVYWFHPLVWIAHRQLVLEAERACDDVVLQRSEATAYADQLVALAGRLMTARSPSLLAMANRHELPKRIAALLDSRQRRGRAGAFSVGLACVASAVLVTAISPLHIVAGAQPPASQTQPTADHQKFDVAAVKPCKEEDFTIPGQRRPEFTVSPGRVTVNCLTLERIIFFAYAGIGNLDHPLLNDSPSNPNHVRGGPGWIRSETFVIEATAQGTSDRTVMMGPMLRTLLEERFHLKTHRETEQAPMYALTVAKGGLKIQPLGDGDCTSPDTAKDLSPEARLALSRGPKPICGGFTSLGDGVNGDWTLGGESLSKFANQTLTNVLDRYVMDKTGVAGLFNIHLHFGFDDNIKPGIFGGRPSLAYSAENSPPADIERAPSIFTALEEQLGLKLEKANGPREFLVIDSVERPTENGNAGGVRAYLK